MQKSTSSWLGLLLSALIEVRRLSRLDQGTASKFVTVFVPDVKPLGLSFWRNRYNETRICPLPSGREQLIRYNGTAVPILYRVDYDGTECTGQFKKDGDFRNASQFEVDQLKRYGAESAILLLDKGRSFVARWHDYLFSDFHDPYINATAAIPTFFLYSHVFQEDILGLAKDRNISRLQLRFHRPSEGPIDLSMVIVWLLAVGCVLGGGVWAFFRHRQVDGDFRAGKDKLHVNTTSNATYSSQSDSSGSFESRCRCLAKHSNFLAIIVLMVILVGILMIGFFFRPVLVTFFNVMLVLFGSISVYACIMAVLSNISFCECCSTKLCTWVQHRWIPDGRPNLIQLIVYTFSLGICVIWFIYRRTPYAFILLDFINVTLCLHILKSLRLPSVKWISALMLCMFIYDAVMVFVTPFLTRNGCSVMLEVATGIDCSSSGTDGYPMPPIDAALPEKFPMLMQVPHFDPMSSCIDLDIEKGFQMTILGLGDIIIPGYLVTHCFTMNGFEERVRISYGILCSIGYGLGLILTFFALALMNMAQPALIYLVPCTLLPICIMAFMRGQFRLLWDGAEDLTDSTASLKPNTDDDTGPQGDS
ncbi:signal peptide peptidase [Ostertagia ostertagi]